METSNENSTEVPRRTFVGWCVVALVALLTERLLTGSRTTIQWPVLMGMFVVFSMVYWRLGPVLHGLAFVFSTSRNLEILGQEVLDPGWKIVSGFSEATLLGRYRGHSIYFQYMPQRSALTKIAILLECPMRKNFHFSAEDTDTSHRSTTETRPISQIPGFLELFSIADWKSSWQRLNVQPLPWLRKKGLLLIIVDDLEKGFGPSQFKQALGALMDLAKGHPGARHEGGE